MDFITLGLAIWLILAGAAAVLYGLAQGHPRMKGIRWFAGGLGMCAAGIGLKLLHHHLPDWAAILVSSAIMLLGLVLLRRGLAAISGRDLDLYLLDALVVLGQTGALAYYTYAVPEYSARFAVIGVAIALEAGLALVVLWVAPATSSVSLTPTKWVVGAFGVFNLLRAAAAIGLQPQANRLGWVESATALVTLLFAILVVLGAMWLATSERYRQLSEQIMQDTLTGLLNRRALRHALARAIERSRHGGEPLALLTMDLDLFKQVNDTRGHSAGDAALCAVARALSAAVRANDVVARLGGEEFVILLPGLNMSAAFLGAERLRRAVAALRFLFEGEHVPLSASLGVAVFDASHDPGESAADQLLRQADLALYVAKRGGRNRTATSDEVPANAVRGHSDRWRTLPGEELPG